MLSAAHMLFISRNKTKLCSSMMTMNLMVIYFFILII